MATFRFFEFRVLLHFSTIFLSYMRKCGYSPKRTFLEGPRIVSVIIEVKGQGQVAVLVHFGTFLLLSSTTIPSNVSKCGLFQN